MVKGEKKLKMKSKILLIIICLFIIGNSFAQKKPVAKRVVANNKNKVDSILITKPAHLTRILFIFDASNSMNGIWQSDKKIVIAERILSNMLDSLRSFPELQIALRVYGHQKYFPPQDCNDSKLEVPFEYDNITKIKHKLKQITPRGTTPIAMSLEKCINDFTPCPNCRNIVILITDGLEECGGDPCKVSIELQKRGIILKPFIIGIGENFKEAFDCVGNYYDASSEDNFNTALKTVIKQALKPTSCQVNLLNESGLPTETNCSMTFYDTKTGEEKYNLEHTLNYYGSPDTIYIDGINRCSVKAHTIPPVWSDTVNIYIGKHTSINIKAPQGGLLFKVADKNAQYRTIPIILKKAGDKEIINVQYADNIEKYIIGKYDAEIMCMPRISFKNLQISQSKTTTLEIPAPGIADVNKGIEGFGSLFVIRNGKNEWIYNLLTNNRRETVLLQPGKYKIVFRSKNSNKTEDSKEINFEIKSNIKTTVNVFEIKK